jgi:apolipoprotein N-acyltransferase
MSQEGTKLLDQPVPVTRVKEAPRYQSSAAAPGWTLGPALLTGGLLWLTYFPANCGWIAWVALAPLLSLVRTTARPWRIYTSAWLGGLLCYTAALQWMRVADYRMYATWIGLALYCSLYFPFQILLLRILDRRTRLPLVVTVPVVWTALELFRAHFATGFAWYFLGHSQHAFLPLIQISDVGGAYAVTFVLAMVNAWLFERLYAWDRFRAGLRLPAMLAPQPRLFGWQSGAVVLVVAAALGYGFWRLGQQDSRVGPRVALIQGNLDQRIRNNATDAQEEEALQTMRSHFVKLTDQAAAQDPKPNLIVWPETSHIEAWMDLPKGLPEEQSPPSWQHALAISRARFRGDAKRWGTNLLFGVNGYTPDANWKPERWNSAVLVDAEGAPAGRYDKIHRVPFGEYVPLRDWIPWMNQLAPYDYDYSVRQGERMTRFTLGSYHFGMLICFEDTDPYLARQYARDESDAKPVDFLVNISNDGWFDGTSEHEEHLAICRFRAVESRRAIVRAVNMGISAVIDADGRVVALPGPSWAASKKVAAVLTAAVPIDSRSSPYARWGDWLPITCWIGLAVGMLLAVVRPASAPRATIQDAPVQS